MAPPTPVDYDGPMARSYDAGRSLPEETVRSWVEAATAHLPASTEFVLDLGAGTGRFAATLAEGLGVGVLAMEPAEAMRLQASRKIAKARVLIIGGRAEALPVRSSSIGMVWASQVLHHVTDLAGCARELKRVLIDDGRVLVRGSFNAESWVLGPYFRAAAEQLQVMPQLETITAMFADVGLEVLSHERIEQTVARTGEELLQRTRLRADSVLARLPDSTFLAGLQELSDDVDQGRFADPITEALDLVVFGPA